MVDEYKERGWPLHVLLNNAGIQVRGLHMLVLDRLCQLRFTALCGIWLKAMRKL